MWECGDIKEIMKIELLALERYLIWKVFLFVFVHLKGKYSGLNIFKHVALSFRGRCGLLWIIVTWKLGTLFRYEIYSWVLIR